MPLSKAARDMLCANALNTYLFDKVWNEPASEFRINIKPLLLKKGSVVGSFSAAIGTVLLPTAKESYYIWAISASDFNLGTKIPPNTWVSTATLVNEWSTTLHMCGTNGALFHKNYVYLQYDSSREVIYVAVLKRMALKCITNAELNSVYVAVYYDSDIPNDTRMVSLEVLTSRNLQSYQRQIDILLSTLTNEQHLQVFCDGLEITNPGTSIPLVVGSFVDVVVDENIAFVFDTDITSSGENPVFLSEKDKTWKQLIHIPKTLNPTNKVITHNTCDFYIRKKFSSGVSGRFLLRAGDRSVTQVTHNDMAIPLFVLDAYRDYLGTQEISIRTVVRLHNKNNSLIRDASYIDLLYSKVHDDQKIINILCGKGPSDIPWWKAVNLESSAYVGMFFDTPNIATIDHMDEYVAALGFYQVVNLLCQRVVDTIITDGFKGSLTFSLPILYTGMKVIPVAYLNKKPIRREYLSYVNNTNGSVTLSIDKRIVTSPGDALVVIFFVNGDNSIYEFEVTTSQITFSVPYDDVTIYHKHVAKDSVTLKGVGHSSEFSYTKLNKNANQYTVTPIEGGGTKITFNPSYAGETFLIQSAYCSYYQSFDLSEYTAAGKTLAIPVQSQLYKSITDCPILNFQNVSVYLNGKYLVRGIDYFINTVKDSAGDIGFHEVVIQTMDAFIEGVTDRLDLLFNVAEIEDLSTGFTIDNALRDETPVNLYFPNISTTHVDGQLERKLEYQGIQVNVTGAEYPQGTIFEIQTSVPKLVKDFILQYSSNGDIERLKVMNAYFNKLVTVVPDILVLEDKNRIYSTFMNTFLYDIVNGATSIIDEPDVNRMAEQIRPYLYLRDMDLCFTNIDKRFVDFYPQYVNYQVDPRMKRLIDKFIEIYMPKNTDPTVEVVYE